MNDVAWLNEDSRAVLKQGYLTEGQSPENRIREICETAEEYIGQDGFADEFEQQILNGWVSFASPIWSNFGNIRGLPVSCNGSYVEDSIESILVKTAEIGYQTKTGAGTSAYVGDIRPRGSSISVGGETDGPVHFMRLMQETINVISQSNVRRGNCAVYINIDHDDIMEFLECRSEGNIIQTISLGVTVPDAWMNDMLAGDEAKREIWLRVLKMRFETGFPYIMFSDTVNDNAPEVYKDKGLKIHASNLCDEIALSSGPDESFVCCLSSVNLEKYDEWKDSTLVRNMIFFLDSVMEEYIQKTATMPLMATAHKFAKSQRAVGLGVLGWHSYLQQNMIPFGSLQAKGLNQIIFKNISEKSLAASQEIASLDGEPELLKGYGRANVTTMANAPTTTSSFILGQVSQSTEPWDSNYFTKRLAKGNYTIKNKVLGELLATKGVDTPEVWKDILEHGGSVAHLDVLTDHEKDVFKTFGEINQLDIIRQASDRQKFIDQGQSINITIHSDTPVKDVHELMVTAWSLGLKGLYYQHGTNAAQELNRSLTQCAVCEA